MCRRRAGAGCRVTTRTADPSAGSDSRRYRRRAIGNHRPIRPGLRPRRECRTACGTTAPPSSSPGVWHRPISARCSGLGTPSIREANSRLIVPRIRDRSRRALCARADKGSHASCEPVRHRQRGVHLNDRDRALLHQVDEVVEERGVTLPRDHLLVGCQRILGWTSQEFAVMIPTIFQARPSYFSVPSRPQSQGQVSREGATTTTPGSILTSRQT